MKFDLEENPFQYFGENIKTIHIEGINWDDVKFQKSTIGKGFFHLVDRGLVIQYVKKDFKVLGIRVYSKMYDNGVGFNNGMGFKTYTGKLPKGVSLLMSRKEVLSKLGNPNSSGIHSSLCQDLFPTSYYSNSYDFGDGWLTLHYSRDEIQQLHSMSISINGLKLRNGEELNISYPDQIKVKQIDRIKSLTSKIIKSFTPYSASR